MEKITKENKLENKNNLDVVMKDLPPKMNIERDNNNDKSIISKSEINNKINENINYIGKIVDNRRVIFAQFKGQGIEIPNSSLNTTTYEIFSNSDSNFNIINKSNNISSISNKNYLMKDNNNNENNNNNIIANNQNVKLIFKKIISQAT